MFCSPGLAGPWHILAKLQLAERAQAIIAARDAGLGRQAERDRRGSSQGTRLQP